MLDKVSSKDTGEAGELLRELMVTVDDSELSGVKKVPILGTVVIKIEQVRRELEVERAAF